MAEVDPQIDRDRELKRKSTGENFGVITVSIGGRGNMHHENDDPQIRSNGPTRRSTVENRWPQPCNDRKSIVQNGVDFRQFGPGRPNSPDNPGPNT